MYDKTAANELQSYVFSHRFESWLSYKKWHENTLAELADDFKKKADPIRELENPRPGQVLRKGISSLPCRSWPFNTFLLGQLQTIEYIRAYGIEMLPYCLSVIVSRHRSDPRLYWFNSTKDESPVATQVVRECCGLLLHHEPPDSGKDEALKNGKWTVICYPLHWFPSYDWGVKPYYHVRTFIALDASMH